MSLEDQYDAWVRSVTGTGRHSATKQDRDAAQNSLNAMQAQLDALAESQKRQKSAADALNTVQRAGAATADSVRRMSSELTQSLRQDGLLGGKTAQPAPAAEPVKAGPENFNGLADRVRQQVLGQDAFVGQVVKAFRRPFVMGTADTAHARGSMLLCGPTGTGRHYALTCIVDEMAGRGLLHSALIETMDLALYPGPAQEKLFLQDLYAALQSDAEVLAFDHYESCASNYLNMLATLAIDGTLPLTSRYVLQRGILVDVGTALAPGAIGELQAAGKYFVFFSNRDETALEAARQRLAPYADRVTLVHSNFSRVAEVLDELGIPAVDGMLFDLGVSSPQLDDAQRGFSYMHDAPLDMRMDRTADLTARTVVNEWSYEELRRILYEYGEERYAPAIAKRICQHREQKPIETTLELADIIRSAMPASALREKQHPAKRSFQAIRIAVNDELAAVREMMDTAPDKLRTGGRLCVISFHSLEDRIVKAGIARREHGCTCPREAPVCTCGFVQTLRSVSRKPILPGEEELASNPRARSAKLRVAERV